MAMQSSVLAVRAKGRKANLWLNNGTWAIAFGIYPTPITKARVRLTLKTKSVTVARRRRDLIFRGLKQGRPLDVVYREAVGTDGSS